MRKVLVAWGHTDDPLYDDVFSQFLSQLHSGRWKKAVIIPLLKMNKDPSKRNSYRPVSLTPVLANVIERMVVNRLYSWMEEGDLCVGK